MQQVPNEFTTAIKTGHHIKGKPLTVAEWNFNHFVKNTVTNNDEPETAWPYNKLYFPIDSITDGRRPKSGIFYAFTDSDAMTSEEGIGLPSQRYYTVDESNKYKYWMSPALSAGHEVQDYGQILAGDQLEYEITNTSPQVVYETEININKIKTTFNLGATPVSWKIYLNISNTWQLVSTNPSINPVTGSCELWWNGSVWGTTQQLSESVYIAVKGVRIVVETIDQMLERVQLIELACLREINLTSRVIDYSVDMTMDEEDFIYPVGQISSNSGSITISNHDLIIDDQNRTGNFAGLLNVWCEFRLYVDYNLEDYDGDASYLARVATMYTNEWRQINETEYSVDMFDIMKLLQNTTCPAILIEEEPMARVVSRILDLVGVDSYSFQIKDFDSSAIIKYFWTNGEESIYEALKNICKSYQSAIFADEYGEIQLLTKKEIADEEDAAVWTFLGQNDDDEIPDIIQLKNKYQTTANHVIIKYKKRQAKVDQQDLSEQPLTSKVWGADDTIVLRSSPLILTNLTAEDDPTWPLEEDTSKRFHIPQKDSEVWPYNGKVNINGEVIEYDAKEYSIWNYTTNTQTTVFLESEEQKRQRDMVTWKSHPSGGGTDGTRPNKFTGKIRVKERDLTEIGKRTHFASIADGWYMLEFWHPPLNSPNAKRFYRGDSSVSALGDYKSRSPWTKTQSRWTAATVLKYTSTPYGNIGVGKIGQDPGYSVLKCDTSDLGNTLGVSFCAMRKFENNAQMRQFGTRIMFETEGAVAGIVFNANNSSEYDIDDDGPESIEDATKAYFVNITTTKTCDNRFRGFRDEVAATVESGNAMGPLHHITSTRGIKANVEVGKWYDLEVIFSDTVMFGGKSYSVAQVFLNGQFVSSFAIVSRYHPTRWAGLHTGGAGKVAFDYFYATSTIGERYTGGNYDDTDAFALKLPSGTNVTKTFNLPRHPGPQGNLAISIVGQQSFQINSLSLTEYNPFQNRLPTPYFKGYTIKELGPATIPARTKKTWDRDIFSSEPTQIDINYTSTGNASLLYETSKTRTFDYNPLTIYNIPSDDSIWDVSNGGFISNRINSIFFTGKDDDSFAVDEFGNIYNRLYFMDEFGAIVHEVRDFSVDLDTAPVKGLNVYCSNQKVKVTDHSYHPTKGIFTLTNASRKNEVVNGTEEIDDSNSIEHTLMLYGYVLEDKGEQEKEVKDEASIKRRGEVKVELDADWIFDDESAKELSEWIVKHWGDPKDALEMQVFSNTFTQIGDKINIKYDLSGIDDELIYVVTGLRKSFGEDGYTSTVSVRQVK
jgi:hypothetical protein